MSLLARWTKKSVEEVAEWIQEKFAAELDALDEEGCARCDKYLKGYHTAQLLYTVGLAQRPTEPLQDSDPCITPWLSSGIHTLCHVASSSCLVLSMFDVIYLSLI